MVTLEAIKAKRTELLALAARRGARNLRVFGSVARGEAGPDSDLDLIVEMEPGRSVLDLLALISELEDALGTRVHLVEDVAPRDPLLDRVLKLIVPV